MSACSSRPCPSFPTTVFLDLGCGRGNYLVPVAKAIGPRGRVFGIDAWQEGLDDLKSRFLEEGISNIETVRANLNEHIPMEDGSADICFMATVLHDLLRKASSGVVMEEITRVLKPSGKFCVIEFKKIEDSPGPSPKHRLSPEETERVVVRHGFARERIVDVGPYHYLLVASRA